MKKNEQRVLQALFKGTDKEVYRRNTRHQVDPISNGDQYERRALHTKDRIGNSRSLQAARRLSERVSEAASLQGSNGETFIENTRQGTELETAKSLQAIHMIEEHRPIENRWDVVVASTARARSITHQDARVELERYAGSLLYN